MLNLLIVGPALLPFLIYTYIEGYLDQSNAVLLKVVEYATLIPAGIYIFPAIVATVDVLRMYQENTTKGVFKEFFKSLFKHFFKSFIISICIFLILFILLMDFPGFKGPLLYFFLNLHRFECLIGLMITLSFLLLLAIMLTHLPLVIVYFDGLSLLQYLKLAFIMAFKNVWKTLVILLIIIGFIVADFLIPAISPVILFILGISLPLYFIVRISFKEYIKIYRKVERRENEESI
jgi:uncharacterized membrane protein YesL